MTMRHTRTREKMTQPRIWTSSGFHDFSSSTKLGLFLSLLDNLVTGVISTESNSAEADFCFALDFGLKLHLHILFHTSSLKN